MTTKEEDGYNSSEDEDYVPQAYDDPDEVDDLDYDDVEDDLIDQKQDVNFSEIKTENITKKDSEVEKKRIDALWANFLDDSDTPISSSTINQVQPSTAQIDTQENTICNEKKSIDDPFQSCSKHIRQETYIFAGEEVKTTTIEQKSGVGDGIVSNAKRKWVPGTNGSRNLTDTVKCLTKKKKMSVLDKTDHDWKEFVAKEGIVDDLKSHGRSKNAYLENQEFLQKADYSQFEKEKSLRQLERMKK